MKVVKIVDYTRLWKGKDGKDRPSTTYRLVYTVGDAEKYICIVPKFAESNRDWYALDNLATVETKGEKPTSNS